MAAACTEAGDHCYRGRETKGPGGQRVSQELLVGSHGASRRCWRRLRGQLGLAWLPVAGQQPQSVCPCTCIASCLAAVGPVELPSTAKGQN